MTGAILQIAQTAQDVILDHLPLIARLASERKKFEDWLQLQVFDRLMTDLPTIQIERAIPGTKERCDFWVGAPDGPGQWVELKLCVTNYCSKFTGSLSARPITTQVADVIRDLRKLGSIPSGDSGHVLVFAYPVPSAAGLRSAWHEHVQKIAREAKSLENLSDTLLVNNTEAASMVGFILEV